MSEPSFYAIIPADVRYDKVLCANAKLLYGEITALANKEGFCWASNEYFAKLYEVDKNTISRWVSSLRAQGYIRVEIIDRVDRKIFIADSRIREKDFEDIQKSGGGSTKKTNQDLQKDGHINTVNSTINNTEREKEKPLSQNSKTPEEPFDPIPYHLQPKITNDGWDFNAEGAQLVIDFFEDYYQREFNKSSGRIKERKMEASKLYNYLSQEDKIAELKEIILQFEYSWHGHKCILPKKADSPFSATPQKLIEVWDKLSPNNVPPWIREGHATEREWKNARALQLEAEKEKARQVRIPSQGVEIYDPMQDPAMLRELEGLGS